jgi:DDE family transposase
MLPKETGRGSRMTCWRRLKERHEAGVWRRLDRVLLDRLGKANHIDWSRASLASASVPAPGGRKGQAESDQSRQTGWKRHLVVDNGGVPLVVRHTAANAHDSAMFEEMVDFNEPLRRARGRPR